MSAASIWMRLTGRKPKAKWFTFRRKVEKAEGDALSFEVPILKVDSERRIVFGIVLEPGTPDQTDAQNDWATAPEIEKSCHEWMRGYAARKTAMGLQHEKRAPSVEPVECFLAPCDFEMPGAVAKADGSPAKKVKAGSWVLGVYVGDDKIWKGCKDGSLTGFSIAGTAERIG
jgi:DNA adenine methylase